MVLELLFGVALLAIAGYIIFRIVGNIALGVLLVLIVFLASYLLVGSFPKLDSIPVIGRFVPTTGNAIDVFKNLTYNIDVITVARDSNNNLLVAVSNVGQSDATNITAYVDGNQINILNNQTVLKAGDRYIIELNWTGDFNNITIKSDNAEAVYQKQ
ncbi:MAG: hypothetical protein HYW23_02920 [Candidatus Aenigmarchaeota archaeon]|nr:hypothetical protein [Candidatus Aenigmarchaeota archaeon]